MANLIESTPIHFSEPSPPGDTIWDRAEESHLTVNVLATRLKLSPSDIASLRRGDLIVSREIAERLSDVLGSSVEFWMNRESNYRQALNRQCLNNAAFADEVRVLGMLTPDGRCAYKAIDAGVIVVDTSFDLARKKFSVALEATHSVSKEYRPRPFLTVPTPDDLIAFEVGRGAVLPDGSVVIESATMSRNAVNPFKAESSSSRSWTVQEA